MERLMNASGCAWRRGGLVREGQGRVARARIFGCAHGGIRFRARASVRAWAEQ